MDAIRVLVVDESPGLAQDLLLTFRRRAGLQVIGPVPDGDAALELMRGEPVDVVVVDLDRHDGAGIATVATIRAGADVRVMVATASPATTLVELALASGACGVLPVDREASRLMGAFRRVVAGELVLPVDELPTLVGRVRQARVRRTERALVATLTSREQQILTALTEGASTSEIAASLGISTATVQTHVKNVLGKLGVHSKVEAVGAAWRAGLTAGSRSA